MEEIITFGDALEALKNGFCVSRQGWNGKGMWLVLVAPKETVLFFDNNSELQDYETHPFIAMKTVDDKLVPWLASQTDMLAEDWCIV